MFLNATNRMKKSQSGDDGSGLVLVIAVMSVMIVLALLVAGMSAQASGYTTSTRAKMQSVAAAEAGADYAAAQLSAGATCNATYNNPISASAPVFTATVQYSLSATGSSWAACPFGGAAAVRIKIVSQGFASSKGTAGQKAGDSSKVEAIYNYTPAASISATGSAIYTYETGTFNNMKALSSTLNADIMVKTGAFKCTSGGKVQGNVLVAAGPATMDNACEVTGDLWSSGIITLGDAKVGGNVLSASTDTSSFSSAARVAGFLDLAGPATTWASRCPSPKDTWDEAGNRCAIQQGVVTGSVTFRDATVQAPVVPDWLDYGFKPADWTAAGFQVLGWPIACNVDKYTMDNSTWFKSTFLNLSTPTVFDTRSACPNGIIFPSEEFNWAMKTDIAFIENKVSIQSLAVTSSNAAQARRLWFITPDSNLTDRKPNCAGESFNSAVNASTTIASPVVAMVYTPCKMSNSSNSWRGQMYGGAVDFDSANGMAFVPVGLPGANVGAGAGAGGGGAAGGGTLGIKISSRDLDG